jgi:hypothetical protein
VLPDAETPFAEAWSRLPSDPAEAISISCPVVWPSDMAEVRQIRTTRVATLHATVAAKRHLGILCVFKYILAFRQGAPAVRIGNHSA